MAKAPRAGSTKTRSASRGRRPRPVATAGRDSRALAKKDEASPTPTAVPSPKGAPAADKDSSAPPKRAAQDLVLVHSPTEDGTGVNVIRQRGDRLEAGQMRPAEEGKPIGGELVRLTPVSDVPNVFHSETLYDARTERAKQASAARQSSGPPQVATDRYRKNWDAIWRRRPTALN